MMNADFTLALMGLLAAMLVWIAVQDVRTYTISDRLNVAIALLAPIYWLSTGVPLWPDAAIRIGVAVVLFMLFAGAFYMNAMGGGDVKLAGALALWFTPYETLTMIVIMSIVGGLLTLVVVAIHKMKRKEGRPQVPYGVAIAMGGMWLLAQRFLNHFA